LGGWRTAAIAALRLPVRLDHIITWTNPCCGCGQVFGVWSLRGHGECRGGGGISAPPPARQWTSLLIVRAVRVSTCVSPRPPGNIARGHKGACITWSQGTSRHVGLHCSPRCRKAKDGPRRSQHIAKYLRCTSQYNSPDVEVANPGVYTNYNPGLLCYP
jgi:hypothetical protein